MELNHCLASPTAHSLISALHVPPIYLCARVRVDKMMMIMSFWLCTMSYNHLPPYVLFVDPWLFLPLSPNAYISAPSSSPDCWRPFVCAMNTNKTKILLLELRLVSRESKERGHYMMYIGCVVKSFACIKLTRS